MATLDRTDRWIFFFGTLDYKKCRRKFILAEPEDLLFLQAWKGHPIIHRESVLGSDMSVHLHYVCSHVIIMQRCTPHNILLKCWNDHKGHLWESTFIPTTTWITDCANGSCSVWGKFLWFGSFAGICFGCDFITHSNSQYFLTSTCQNCRREYYRPKTWREIIVGFALTQNFISLHFH